MLFLGTFTFWHRLDLIRLAVDSILQREMGHHGSYTINAKQKKESTIESNEFFAIVQFRVTFRFE